MAQQVELLAGGQALPVAGDGDREGAAGHPRAQAVGAGAAVEDAGTLVMLGGAVVGLYGLYLFLT